MIPMVELLSGHQGNCILAGFPFFRHEFHQLHEFRWFLFVKFVAEIWNMQSPWSGHLSYLTLLNQIG